MARLKGNGSKRPILLMAHTDVVNVDPKKWTHPPFSATRQAGYVYGRGAVDDKDNVVAVLMVMLTLKRLNVPLDRDVIALFEAGEEGATRIGIQYMVNEHFPSIDAEYCLAEGANTMPTMSTGASDVAFLRAKGVQCYGIGPALDVEDGPQGFGAHSDQERILKDELQRFVRFHYDVVMDIAGKTAPGSR